MNRPGSRGMLAAALACATLLALAACQPGLGTSSSGLSASLVPQPSSASAAPGGGGPRVIDLVEVDLELVRQLLLGDPPYPSGWEESANRLADSVTAAFENTRVPDVAGLEPARAACKTWSPMVGNTDWATGAFVERGLFLAHVRWLAQVGPVEVSSVASNAAEVVARGFEAQTHPSESPDVIGQYPENEVRLIGLWAVEHCDLPVEADEPPDTEGWTEDEIAQSCTWDREWLENAQQEYFDGPGQPLYAEHPHVLEVTLEIFAYPAWHRRW